MVITTWAAEMYKRAQWKTTSLWAQIAAPKTFAEAFQNIVTLTVLGSGDEDHILQNWASQDQDLIPQYWCYGEGESVYSSFGLTALI